MGASQSTRAKSKFVQYEAILGEIALISDYKVRLERLEELIRELISETNALNSDEGSKLSKQTRESLKYRSHFLIQECRDIVRYYELIINLSKMKAQIYTKDFAPFERQITTARQELEKVKSNQTIDKYHKQDIIARIDRELQRLDIEKFLLQISEEIRASIKEQYIASIEQCRDIVRFYGSLLELSKLKAPIYKRDEAPFEKQITTARRELEELKSNLIIDDFHKNDLITRIETEIQRLDKEVIDQVLQHVSPEIRASLQKLYLTNFKQRKDIVKYYNLVTELSKLKAPIYKSHVAPFERQITRAKKELEELKSNLIIDTYHKHDLIVQIETELKRLDEEVTDQFLNVEVRDSIDLIEKTLKEPHLYSLPHLIMWRDTAREKIQKIQNFPLPIPQELAQALIEKYESLYKKLRVEILKLRTYPIPEPWRSHCMRQELTHLIKGEFIFFVHPGIEEDMRPLILSERDILPGGLTRQVYDSRMDRMIRESVVASKKLLAKNASDIERKLKWIEDSFSQIEKEFDFAFTELPLLYRDERSLDYLVNKNQDDVLLKEIYDFVLRRIRHFYNNRINIPSVDIDIEDNSFLVAPPKGERNIPIASGVDRGATEGLQLVTPASVLVVDKTVFVADRCGHLLTGYRDSDLETLAWNHLETADTPVSLTVFEDSLFVCYTNKFGEYSLSWDDEFNVHRIQFETCIEIPEISCTACNRYNLFVGTLKPSLILMNSYTLGIKREYPLKPIRYHANKKSRYPWLQDMKATSYSIICLFTGSPFPLQKFSLLGDFICSILTEDQIVGAYHFNLFRNPVTTKWLIYITDFWDSAIKVFDLEGRFKETFSEKGFELGQIFHPTGIFVEESGLIIVCDMKEENCLQRL